MLAVYDLHDSQCLMLHHKAFRADYISRNTKIHAPSRAAQILVDAHFNTSKYIKLLRNNIANYM